MTPAPSDPIQVARDVADIFEKNHVPYALGGALAYNLYGAFRTTLDVDFNVFLPSEDPEEVGRVLTELSKDGLTVDLERSVRRALDGSHVVALAGQIHVDIFFNSIPLHRSAAKRVRRHELASRPIQALSAEDIVLLKLLFFRPKDKLDIERVVQRQGPALDRAYVREWLVDMMGEDDERVRVWDRYCAELPGTPSPE